MSKTRRLRQGLSREAIQDGIDRGPMPDADPVITLVKAYEACTPADRVRLVELAQILAGWQP